MNRQQFMRELERLLQNIPESERTEALNYYEEYFNDAGEEKEQDVIGELESPQKVADSILDGLRANMDYRDSVPGGDSSVCREKEGMPAWAIALIVIGCIICSPVIIGAAGTLLGVLAAVFFTFFGLIAGFGAAGAALVFSGLCVAGVGFLDVTAMPFAGLTLAGAGLILLAAGILCVMLTVWLCGWAVPATCRGIAWLWHQIFNKDKANG